MTYIVGFGHRKRVGKDTLANLMTFNLTTALPSLHIKRTSLAVKMKEVSYDIFRSYGLQVPDYYEDNPEEKEQNLPHMDVSPRDIYIAVGQGMREIHSDVWLNMLLSDCQNVDILILSDIRFENEVRICDLAVRVDRDSAGEGDGPDNALAHYDKWDKIIDNNGSMADLSKAADLLTTLVKEAH